MPRPIPADELDQIEKAVRAHPGITSAEIADVLGEQVPRRTLQFRLKRLVDDGRVLREGGGRWARYSAPEAVPADAVLRYFSRWAASLSFRHHFGSNNVVTTLCLADTASRVMRF